MLLTVRLGRGCRRRRVCEGPRPEMVYKHVARPHQLEAGFPGLGAQDVRVEQAQVRPLVELSADLVEYRASDEQAEALKTGRLDEFAAFLRVESERERIDGLHVHKRIARPSPFAWTDAVWHRLLDPLLLGRVVAHRS